MTTNEPPISTTITRRLHVFLGNRCGRTYGHLFSGNTGLVQNTAPLCQSSTGIWGSPAAASRVPRTRHATPALRNANEVPLVPSAPYTGMSCHARAEKSSRRRNAASPAASARANNPEIANPHPMTGPRSVSSLKIPGRRWIETPGVFAAIVVRGIAGGANLTRQRPWHRRLCCSAAPKLSGTTRRTNSEAAKKIRPQSMKIAGAC